MRRLHPDNQRRAWQSGHKTFNQSPAIVFYEITQACQLVCRHCRACAQTQAHPAELTPGQSRCLLDQLAQFPEPPALVITGGDPLMRADIYRTIEFGRSRGLEIAITPSATPLVTQQALRRLRSAGICRLAISLDGADAATHDGIRGVPGIYDRTWEIIQMVRDLDIPLQINTTLQPCNFGQIEAIAEQISRVKLELWSVFFLVPVGRAGNMPRLNAGQCEQAFERLWQQSQIRPYRIKTTEAPHYRRFVLQQLRRHDPELEAKGEFHSLAHFWARSGINDGKGIMFVSHAGLIYPSGFLPVVCGAFPLSNVVDVYQDSPIFRALRDAKRLEGKCQVCEYREICGGSRARAYAVTNNLLAQEPDCAYVPALMLKG